MTNARAVVLLSGGLDSFTAAAVARELVEDATDLSDLAYRIWKIGERANRRPTISSYEVTDSAGRLRSAFSVIPEPEIGRPGTNGVAAVSAWRSR